MCKLCIPRWQHRTVTNSIGNSFLESANSRAPVNCSTFMLKTLLTYHRTYNPRLFRKRCPDSAIQKFPLRFSMHFSPSGSRKTQSIRT